MELIALPAMAQAIAFSRHRLFCPHVSSLMLTEAGNDRLGRTAKDSDRVYNARMIESVAGQGRGAPPVRLKSYKQETDGSQGQSSHRYGCLLWHR